MHNYVNATDFFQCNFSIFSVLNWVFFCVFTALIIDNSVQGNISLSLFSIECCDIMFMNIMFIISISIRHLGFVPCVCCNAFWVCLLHTMHIISSKLLLCFQGFRTDLSKYFIQQQISSRLVQCRGLFVQNKCWHENKKQPRVLLFPSLFILLVCFVPFPLIWEVRGACVYNKERSTVYVGVCCPLSLYFTDCWYVPSSLPSRVPQSYQLQPPPHTWRWDLLYSPQIMWETSLHTGTQTHLEITPA